MRRARDHALAGPAGDFAARFRAAGRAHSELRDSLERDIQAIVRLIDRFNTIAPRGAAHFRLPLTRRDRCPQSRLAVVGAG